MAENPPPGRNFHHNLFIHFAPSFLDCHKLLVARQFRVDAILGMPNALP
jgi:hypothetical protein